MSESNASEDGRKRIQLCDLNEAIHAKDDRLLTLTSWPSGPFLAGFLGR